MLLFEGKKLGKITNYNSETVLSIKNVFQFNNNFYPNFALKKETAERSACTINYMTWLG